MGSENKILEKLNNRKYLYYKGTRVNFLGLPVFKDYKPKTLENSFSNLKKKGFVTETDNLFKLTEKGQKYINKKSFDIKRLSFKNENGAPKNLIVIYDIPENKKKERDWFRFYLKRLDFIMIQKSVWVGPSPLPREFLSYVEEIGLKENFKTFKLNKAYLTK
jgi:DNA-binding transcriptional regulator PaaX